MPRLLDVQVEVSERSEGYGRVFSINGAVFANKDTGTIVSAIGRIPKEAHAKIKTVCQMIIDALSSLPDDGVDTRAVERSIDDFTEKLVASWGEASGQHFAISLDDFSERVHSHLESNQDGGAGHYARYTAQSKQDAVERVLEKLRPLVEQMIYPSDEYGHELGDGDDIWAADMAALGAVA